MDSVKLHFRVHGYKIGVIFPLENRGLGSSQMVLVGGWTTHLKNMLVNLDHFPNFRGEKKTCLKPPR